MTKTLRHMRWCVLATSLAATQCAFAQQPPEPPQPPPRPHRFEMPAPVTEPERTVKDAPYCADALHESVHQLADGNRIVQRQPSRQCRDGQGRTRQEVAVGERRHIYLRDPVAGESWMLDPEGKRAIRISAHRVAVAAPPALDPQARAGWEQKVAEFSREMREWGREMRDWGRDLGERILSGRPVTAAPQPPAAPATPLPVEPGAMPRQVRIVVDGVDMAGLPPPPMPGLAPPGVAWHARMRPPRGPGETTPLPQETIEGLKAEGRRTTWTLPAGRIGNEKPIVVVREVWTSPELGITLRSRESDPLAGEESFRVQNIVRGEPDAALFRVPADYRQAPRSPTPPPPPAKP